MASILPLQPQHPLPQVFHFLRLRILLRSKVVIVVCILDRRKG